MDRLLTSIFTLLCLCLFALSPAKADAIEDQVKAAYSDWDAAFGEADAKAIAAFYTDDAIFLPATHDVIKGPEGVEKFFAGIFDMGVTGHKLELIEAQGDGDLLFGTAKWSANGKDTNGADQPWGGVATHIFEKQADGSLKLRLHTFN
ncbi:YybH family protein [Chelativorans salis]|uniref:Nuclear transport factor 2 family protein n=1 Tax=Chelativorans salis TaxID=2978478 RepID=A0ABT2LTM6_9HYPH|nr:nuclear transport factor 2 family protein [Chelativorans sp. EGI FJ00035]MCT7377891.1 nuclear transport factor 2 family protein [Chelativorans sp. EGI FJ00035]